jgi:cyanophycin synthetase
VTTVEEAWEVAQKVGLPVVVKPQDGNQGKGVTVNITDRAQLEEAYKNAADYTAP